MKIILAGPGGGKTKELLAISAEKNIPVLCESAARAERLIVKAQGYGYNIPYPITVNQIDESVKAVLIDDIANFFKAAYGVDVEAITLNTDKTTEVKTL